MRKRASDILDEPEELTVTEDVKAEVSEEGIDDSLMDFSGFEQHVPTHEATNQAIDDGRKQGFIKNHTRVHVKSGRKVADPRQGTPTNIQIRSFTKQDQMLEHIMKTYGFKKKKHAFDAMLAATLTWAEEGRPLSDEMLDPFLDKDYT